MNDIVKLCKKHGELKQSELTTNKRCLYCIREYAKEYRLKYPEKHKESLRKYREYRAEVIKEIGHYEPIRKNNRYIEGRTSIECKKHGLVEGDNLIRREGDYLRCRLCQYERNRSWQKRNPEKQKLYKRATYLKHIDQYVEESRLRQHKITKEHYYKLIEEQDNKCAICNNEESVRTRKDRTRSPLSIDHNHFTGEIRGLLCARCNRGLGCFKESEERLSNAINYLRKYDGRSSSASSSDEKSNDL